MRPPLETVENKLIAPVVDRAKLWAKEGLFKTVSGADYLLKGNQKEWLVQRFSAFPDRYQKQMATLILAAGSPELRQKYQNNPNLLAQATVDNFLRQVVEMTQIDRALRRGQPLPELLDPATTLSRMQQEILKKGAIWATFHSGNPLAVIEFFRKNVAGLGTFGIFAEKQPASIDNLYRRVAGQLQLELLPISRIHYRQSLEKAISTKYQGYLTSLDRGGQSRIAVNFLGKEVEFSTLAASLAQSKQMPILPVAVVVKEGAPRLYQLVFGQVIEPPKNNQERKDVMQTLISQLEAILLQYPEAFYFLSPLVTSQK